MKKILMSLLTIAIVGGLIGGGVFAIFYDVETVGQNVFTAGTLDLEVGSNPSPIPFNITNMKPGDTATFGCTLTNVGSIDGVLKVQFSAITNYENGRTEPEIADNDTYGPLDGELGQYLVVSAFTMGGTGQTAKGVTSLLPWYDMTPRYNVPLNDMGGTTHWLQPPRAVVGDEILEAGDDMNFAITVKLPGGVGNIVQSDSVEFDFIFTLDQAP